jgi:hypothetical protein
MPIGGEDIGRFFKTYQAHFGKCLAPGLACEKTTIRAHSIQNAQVIDLLQTSGHVIALRPHFSAAGPEIDFESVGRNHASTFTGLCEEHDAGLFEPIDTKPLDTRDRQQLFLLAYRSVTRELHAVMEGASKIQSSYSSRVEQGIDPADAPSPAGIVATQHLLVSFFTHEYRAKHFDVPLLSGKFDEVEHDVIVFEDQKPALAVSSLFSLDEVVKEDGDITRVVLNVMPVSATCTLAIFSYTSEDQRKAKAMLERILVSQGEYQKYELSKLILGHIENFLVAPSHFATWGDEKKSRIRSAFKKTAMNGGFADIEDHIDLMLF